MTVAKKKTPIRISLDKKSSLIEAVMDGIGAMKRSDQKLLSEAIRDAFGDSLDIDSSLMQNHAQENRWDYLLGHGESTEIVAVEPHAAAQHEVDVVIRKRKAAKQQLADHLKPSARMSKWIWVTRGKNHFADTEKVRRILDQNGIEFVGGKVLAKHLPKAVPAKKNVKK